MRNMLSFSNVHSMKSSSFRNEKIVIKLFYFFHIDFQGDLSMFLVSDLHHELNCHQQLSVN